MRNLLFSQEQWRELFHSDWKRWQYFGIALHLIAAIFSVGFLQYDEHFEVLEFLAFKLGIAPVSDLSFEFGEKMRPWLQPFFYFWTVKFWQIFGIENRFFWSFCFRLFSSLLGITACWSVTLLSFKWFKEQSYKKWVVIAFNVLWFLPFIHARMSAETVGGSLFTIAFSFLLLSNPNGKIIKSLIIGLIFGFAFQARYHIGIMILFLFLWMLLFRYVKISTLSLLSLGVFCGIGVGIVIDYWGYGAWALAPYNYFHQNIVMNIASKWGVAPWWDYFRLIFKKGVAPIGLIIIIAHLWFWIKNPKHVLTWTTLPFFFIHSYVAHKEMRFLFPLAHFIIPIGIFVILDIRKKLPALLEKKWIRIAGTVVIWINVVLAIQVAFRPVHISTNFYSYIKSNQLDFKKLYVVGDLNPYGLAALPMNYYNFYHPKVELFPTPKDIAQINSSETDFWLFASRGHQFLDLKNRKECELHYLSYPKWVLNLNIGNWLKRSEVWSLFRCRNAGT